MQWNHFLIAETFTYKTAWVHSSLYSGTWHQALEFELCKTFCIIIPFSEGHRICEENKNADQKPRCSARELTGIWLSSSKGIGRPSNCTLRSQIIWTSHHFLLLRVYLWNIDNKPSSCPLPYLLRLGAIWLHTGPQAGQQGGARSAEQHHNANGTITFSVLQHEQ